MHLRYTILYVEDVSASMSFYENAFGLKRKMLHEAGDYGELETGSTVLALSSRKLLSELGKNPGSPDPERPTFELAFETESVDAALKKAVEAGAFLVQEAKEMPWGQTTSYVRDIDGFLVEICSPVTPQKKPG